MTGFFMNGVDHEGTRRDIGFYSEKRDAHSYEKFSQLTREDEAYRVEVKESSEGVIVTLESEGRSVETKIEEKLERRAEGTDLYTYQGIADPVMPGEYDNPGNAVAMYAEHALDHSVDQGVEMEVAWEKVLDEENRGL